MQAQIQAFLASLESQPAYSCSTRVAYERDLRHYYQSLKIALQRPPALPDFTASSIMRFLKTCLEEGWSPATTLRRKAALKQFASYLVGERMIQADPFLEPELISFRVSSPTETKPEPERLSDDQIRRLQEAVERSSRPLARRDCSILALLLEIGMPVSQLIALNVDDVDLPNGRLRIRRPEGDKEGAWISLGNATGPVIAYVREGRVDLNPRPDEKALLISQTGSRMSRQGIWQMLHQLGAKAGLEITLSPRLLRHTVAYRMARQGRNIDELQIYMGHSNPLSTQALVRRLRSKVEEDGNREE